MAEPPHAALEIEPDSATEFSDEAYAESSASSVLTSIASDIKKGREENGRIYAAYGAQEYMLPVDENELDRMDMQHHKYTMLQGDKLYLAPLCDDPQKILDVGTGTGIWAIDMAEKFHSAEVSFSHDDVGSDVHVDDDDDDQVIGTDIAPVQPNWTPPNCYFEVDDCELDWQYKKASFDLIHTRDCYLSIRNWPRLVSQAYDHLKPGGWLELSCVWPVPQCDDDTLDPDSGYVELCQTFMDIGEAIGADADSPRRYKQYMLEQGFEDVEEVVFKVPTSEWPKDKRLKRIGALERLNLLEGGEAFLLRGFTKEFGRTRAEMEVMLMRMRKELMANKFHSYVSFYVVYGKKPDVRRAPDE